jgi:hypothetical protein
MREWTSHEIVPVAEEILANVDKGFAEGHLSEDEKSGAKAAIVALLMGLGIQVTFISAKQN